MWSLNSNSPWSQAGLNDFFKGIECSGHDTMRLITRSQKKTIHHLLGFPSVPSTCISRPLSCHVCMCVCVCVCVCVVNCVWLFATPWTVAHQAPLSMGFPRQEYWSGLPFPSPEDLPDPVSCISYIGRQILYHCSTQEALSHHIQSQVTLKAPCWRGYIERPQRARERYLRRTGWPVFNYLRLLAQARSSFQMIPFSSLQAAPVHISKQSGNEHSPPSPKTADLWAN